MCVGGYVGGGVVIHEGGYVGRWGGDVCIQGSCQGGWGAIAPSPCFRKSKTLFSSQKLIA